MLGYDYNYKRGLHFMKELMYFICFSYDSYDMYVDFEMIYYVVRYVNPKANAKLEK